MTEPKTRLTDEELEKCHDGLCGVSVGDGPCSCIVHWVKALQREADEAKAGFEDLRKRGPLWPEKLVGIACSRALLYGTMVGFGAGVVIGILLYKLAH